MGAGREIDFERLADLERRVLALEERARRALWSEDEACTDREAALVAQYGEAVDKTVAARVLGVTRATVYAMLEDGRIRGACGGRKVDVRSVARYLTCAQDERRANKRGAGREGQARARPSNEEQTERKGQHECA